VDGKTDEHMGGGQIKKFVGRWMHSFIHIEHLYSVPTIKLLRGTPDSSAAKKNSLQVRKVRER